MITLHIHYGPAFSELTGKNEESLTFDSDIKLKKLLEYFYNKYGDKFRKLIWKNEDKLEYHEQLVIIINGKTYRDENFLETVLKDGDDLYFLYIYFGG
ncbi:MAG: MoaD/ThiS family protein [Promethearchaeia archaeon]